MVKRENALVMMVSMFSKRKTDLQVDRGLCQPGVQGVGALGSDGWCVWGQGEGDGHTGGLGELGESQT